MTDEMRVALVAVATGRGLEVDLAWDLVDDLEVEGRPIRDVVEELNRTATLVLYGPVG